MIEKMNLVNRVKMVFTGNVCKYNIAYENEKETIKELNKKTVTLLKSNTRNKELEKVNLMLVNDKKEYLRDISDLKSKIRENENILKNLQNKNFDLATVNYKLSKELDDVDVTLDNQELNTEIIELTKTLNNKKTSRLKRLIIKLIGNKDKQILELKTKLDSKPNSVPKKVIKKTTINNKVGLNTRTLTCEQIRDARKKRMGGMSQRNIAEHFNVTRSTIVRAMDGVTYKECVDC